MKSYAIHDKYEFFAEMSEAYFWKNDYYPFVKSDLKRFDPRVKQMIEEAWGVGKKIQKQVKKAPRFRKVKLVRK